MPPHESVSVRYVPLLKGVFMLRFVCSSEHDKISSVNNLNSSTCKKIKKKYLETEKTFKYLML